MKIDFNKIESKQIPNFKGGDLYYDVKMYDDSLNKVMLGTLVPGASIGTHTHEDTSELIYILEGEGKTITDGVEQRVTTGDCHYCPKGSTHTLINDTAAPLRFFAVVPKQ